MSNAGTATATANAHAIAAVAHTNVNGTGTAATTTTTFSGSAHAFAQAIGMGQDVGGASGSATIVNSGTLNVGAHATASGGSDTAAPAHCTGGHPQTPPGAGTLRH